MVKVSVIIPVFNAEDYLKQSLDSIVNQTIDDIEIICIDDGSDDSSIDILNEYSDTYSNIQIFQQEHKRAGAARNYGLSKAKGKYVFFMDADDVLELDALNEFYEISEERNLDFLIFQITNYDEASGEYFDTDYYLMEDLYQFVEDKTFSFDDLDDHIFDIPVTLCNKFYNREFIDKCGARFPEETLFEDNIFFWKLIFDAERMYLYHKKMYARRIHSNSSMQAGDKRYADSINIYNMVIQIFIDRGYFEKYKKILCNNKIKMVFNRYNGIHEQYKEFFYDAMKEDFTKIINHEMYDDIIENLNSYNLSRFEKVVASRDFYEFEALMENFKLERKLLKLNKQHEKLQNRYDNLSNRHKNLKEKNNALKEEYKAFKKEYWMYRKENKKLNAKVGRLENKIDNLEKTQEEIFSSNSWKLTKPLRKIGSLR